MKFIVACAWQQCLRSLFCIFVLSLSGCTTGRILGTPVVYDFGPGSLQNQPSPSTAQFPVIILADLSASFALDSTAVLYRLNYADAQQLKPYALARWSMPPAQLIRQHLRQQLSQRRSVLNPGELLTAPPPRLAASAAAVAARAMPTYTLRIQLEEFSQLFDTPEKSSGLLRMHATLLTSLAGVESVLSQRSFVVQQVAITPDASGGVHALTAGTDQLVQQMEVWLAQNNL